MSSPTFNREDCIFGVSYNKLNDKWKQTVFSGSCLRKISPGLEVSVAIKQESLPTFFWKTFSSMSRSIIWSAGVKSLLYCKLPAAMFTKRLRFGSNQTIVLSPKQPSFERIAALVFHSTNVTTDGERDCRQSTV